MDTNNSETMSKNWTLNATAEARKIFDSGMTGQSTTSTPWKFDSVFDGAEGLVITMPACLPE